MSRSRFMLVAAVVPWVFGLVMMLVPGMMLANSLAAEFDGTTRAVTQWVGFGVFSIGWITFLARHDEGSPALEAVLVGNVLFHTLGIGFDTYHYLGGVMTLSGLVAGLVPHSLLALGSCYFLTLRPGQPDRGGLQLRRGAE